MMDMSKNDMEFELTEQNHSEMHTELPPSEMDNTSIDHNSSPNKESDYASTRTDTENIVIYARQVPPPPILNP
jgi:hypothetical protein